MLNTDQINNAILNLGTTLTTIVSAMEAEHATALDTLNTQRELEKTQALHDLSQNLGESVRVATDERDLALARASAAESELANLRQVIAELNARLNPQP